AGTWATGEVHGRTWRASRGRRGSGAIVGRAGPGLYLRTPARGGQGAGPAGRTAGVNPAGFPRIGLGGGRPVCYPPPPPDPTPPPPPAAPAPGPPGAPVFPPLLSGGALRPAALAPPSSLARPAPAALTRPPRRPAAADLSFAVVIPARDEERTLTGVLDACAAF